MITWCNHRNSPPHEAEYAEPPEGVPPGFFSCGNCVWVRQGGPREASCVYPEWSQKPPFDVRLAGCCRFQTAPNWACGLGPEEALKPIPEFGNRMTVKQFIANVKAGGFIDYDGYGYYTVGDWMTSKIVRPSDVKSGRILARYTHIIWFNR